MDNERILFGKALEVSKTIRSRPVRSLSTYANEIEALCAIYSQLASQIRDYSPDQASAQILFGDAIMPFDSGASDPYFTAQSEDPPPSFQASEPQKAAEKDVHNLLLSAIRLIPAVQEAAWNFRNPSFPPTRQSARCLHVQNIFTLQRRKLPISASSPERILVICACLSLASDFFKFEQDGGWRPKQEILIERITRGENPAIQTIGKNFKNFLSANDFGVDTSQKKLEAALRFGIKLAVLDGVARPTGLTCLSLLFGFECLRTTRTSFASLGVLLQHIQENSVQQQLQGFEALLGSWWNDCQKSYHLKFGGEDRSRIGPKELQAIEVAHVQDTPMMSRDRFEWLLIGEISSERDENPISLRVETAHGL